MKIGIVTVYNSYNCGSFLQAYALRKTLEQQGHKAVFVKRNVHKSNKFYSRAILSVKRFLKGDPKRATFILKEYFSFNKIQKIFPITEEINGLDMIVYGSDTIWNLEDDYFRECWKRYWGVGVENKKITYAASVGTTDEKVFYNDPVYEKYMKEFLAVSVRDEHTYKIAEKLLDPGKLPVLVTDPTMLVDVSEYEAIAKPCKEKNFILVYYFGDLGDMPKGLEEYIRAFAKEQGKKIIYFGKDIPFEPGMMIGYYKAADYVITNTFHGNVFSIIYNKKFVSFGKEKKKVEILLRDFGLSERLLDVSENPADVLLKNIDYSKTNEILKKKRAESLEYLKTHTNN